MAKVTVVSRKEGRVSACSRDMNPMELADICLTLAKIQLRSGEITEAVTARAMLLQNQMEHGDQIVAGSLTVFIEMEAH